MGFKTFAQQQKNIRVPINLAGITVITTPKIPCNLTKPEKHKLNLSDVVPPEPHISQSNSGGGGGLLI